MTKLKLTLAGYDKTLVIEVEEDDEEQALADVEQAIRSGQVETVNVKDQPRVLNWAHVVMAQPVRPGDNQVRILN